MAGYVIGIYEDEQLTSFGTKVNKETNGALLKKWKLTGKKGKSGESVTLVGISDKYERVAVVGLGKQGEDINNLRLASGAGFKALEEIGATTVYSDYSFGNLQVIAEGVYMASYKYRGLPPSQKIDIIPPTHGEEEWNVGKTIAEAQNWARDLAETPANLMTPSIFVDEVAAKFKDIKGVDVVGRDKAWIEGQRMGLFLGVAQGSAQEPRFVEVHYELDKSVPPLVLIGKGITFDSGGISIKPSANMTAMKADMMGAAAAVSATYAIAKLKLHPHVITLAPMTENLPSGSATKPGDVHTSRSGKTVEVDNTDAEGRLVLGDALDYAKTFNPHTIIDLATLTGAIGVALGFACNGVFTPCEQLWDTILLASHQTSEKMWRMPLFPEYRKQLDSNVADICNVSNTNAGGACTAATFLKEFVDIDRWAHIDIAGTMSNKLNPTAIASNGMSGKPTRTLIEIAKILGKQPGPSPHSLSHPSSPPPLSTQLPSAKSQDIQQDAQTEQTQQGSTRSASLQTESSS